MEERSSVKTSALLLVALVISVAALGQTVDEKESGHVEAYRGAGVTLRAGPAEHDEQDGTGSFHFQEWNWYPFYPFLAPWGFCGPSFVTRALGNEKEPSGTGEVVIGDFPSGSLVFLDGAFAGRVDDLMPMALSAGEHQVRVEIPGRQPFETRVRVVPGRQVIVSP